METHIIKDSTLGILFSRLCPPIVDIGCATGQKEKLPEALSKLFSSWEASKSFCQLRATMVFMVLRTLCTGKFKVTTEDMATPVSLIGETIEKIAAVELHKEMSAATDADDADSTSSWAKFWMHVLDSSAD